MDFVCSEASDVSPIEGEERVIRSELNDSSRSCMYPKHFRGSGSLGEGCDRSWLELRRLGVERYYPGRRVRLGDESVADDLNWSRCKSFVDHLAAQTS